MTIFASACSPIFLAVAWPHESIAESPSISTVIGWLVFRSFVLFIYQQNKHISITYFATPPFLYFWKQTDGSGKAPLVSQPISFLWAKPPLGRIIILWIQVMAERLFQRSLSDTAWVARFLLERSWRTVSVARCIANVSVCFIQFSKSSRLVSLWNLSAFDRFS